jgi:hypothetical protein
MQVLERQGANCRANARLDVLAFSGAPRRSIYSAPLPQMGEVRVSMLVRACDEKRHTFVFGEDVVAKSCCGEVPSRASAKRVEKEELGAPSACL